MALIVRLPPSSVFWDEAAHHFLRCTLPDWRDAKTVADMSDAWVMVPTFEHIQLLRQALARCIGRAFIAPVIMTPAASINLLPPLDGQFATSHSERLMTLYASLREHGWLKKLFSARRNTDLLILAETLLALSDELTQVFLPQLVDAPDRAKTHWQAALASLSPAAQHVLSDETKLVWTIWKSQLDGNDALALRFARMQALAKKAQHALFWINPVAPDAMEQAFIHTWEKRQPVTLMTLDWRFDAIAPVYRRAWHEAVEEEKDGEKRFCHADDAIKTPANLVLFGADSFEAEAQSGAQTILDWLQAGMQHIAIVAQDRVVARRIRALLERAQVYVADETGWKLSTTRAASAVAAWMTVVATHAETVSLLDFLKSPHVFSEKQDKADCLMQIEVALLRGNVSGDWEAVIDACQHIPDAQKLLLMLRTQAQLYTGRHPLRDWLAKTRKAFVALEMDVALQRDQAGQQVLALLDCLERDCARIGEVFSFAEWRAFLDAQLEAAAFVTPWRDRRVVMLPLNGARLRRFDAVLLVGADAVHLPSRLVETLFFANAVRAELGLQTRENRQRQQLRDVMELLLTNPHVVMSWQTHKNGEPNPSSPWLERLELVLAQADLSPLAKRDFVLPRRLLTAKPVSMPTPSAASLRPKKLSASAYNSLVVCPYQFFATRMLGLTGADALSDLPEKRDYGNWLHRILALFHDALRNHQGTTEERATLLQTISERVFGEELKKSAAALGFYARWQKNMPAYLAWVEEWEKQGWQFLSGEESAQKVLRWEEGEIMLYGRIDRIDVDASGAQVVLDYKSTSAQTLKKRLLQGEDSQLPFYGLLLPTPPQGAAYVPLAPDKNRIAEVVAPDFDNWQQALEERIVKDMQAIDQGAALPAFGARSVCQYCEAGGLCRKGMW